MTGHSNKSTKQYPTQPETKAESVAQGSQDSATIDIRAHAESDFFDAAPVLTAVASSDGYLVKTGGAWGELLGWTAADLASVPFFDFVHPDDVESTSLELAKLNEGELTAGFRNRYRKVDGDYLSIQWHARRASDGNIYAIAWDATDLVNAEISIFKEELILKGIAQFLSRTISDHGLTHSLSSALEAVATVTGATGVGIMATELDKYGNEILRGLVNMRAPELLDAGEVAANNLPALVPDKREYLPISAMGSVTLASRMTEPLFRRFTSMHDSYEDDYILAIPLTSDTTSSSGTSVLGVLAVIGTKIPFTTEDSDLLAPLAAAFSTAIIADKENRAAEAMRAELLRLSSLLGAVTGSSDIGMMVFDQDENLTTMNQAAAALLGTDSAAQYHWAAHSLFSHRGEPAPSLQETFNASNRDSEIAVEWSIVSENGVLIPASVQGSPVHHDDGSLSGWVLMCTLLSDKKNASQVRVDTSRLFGQVNLLEIRQSVVRELSHASNYVMASTSQREALQVIEQFLPSAFPLGEARLLHIARTDRSNSISDSTTELVIGPDDCWSLRTGHTFRSKVGEGVCCPHLDDYSDAICLPITDGHDEVAVITVNMKNIAIGLPETAIHSLLDDISSSFSTALANLRLRRALQDQAYLDPLTQVGNRRVAEDSVATGIARFRSIGEEFGIVMVDIDHFKVVNDRFGHEAGDRVLTEFAGHLRSHLREKDSVARLGGEEFLLILQDVTQLEVEKIVEELVKRIDGAEFFDNITVTASMGAVHISTGECTSDELLRHADSLLYEAKRQGRNQFRIGEFRTSRPQDGSVQVPATEQQGLK